MLPSDRWLTASWSIRLYSVFHLKLFAGTDRKPDDSRRGTIVKVLRCVETQDFYQTRWIEAVSQFPDFWKTGQIFFISLPLSSGHVRVFKCWSEWMIWIWICCLMFVKKCCFLRWWICEMSFFFQFLLPCFKAFVRKVPYLYRVGSSPAFMSSPFLFLFPPRTRSSRAFPSSPSRCFIHRSLLFFLKWPFFQAHPHSTIIFFFF